MTDFQTVVGRAITDTTFCTKLVTDPDTTLRQNGITPTPEMIEALRGLDAASVQRLAKAFTKQQAAG